MRSFCFVSDLIAGIVKLAKTDHHTPVNIGNPVEWTILECAHKVLSVTSSTAEIRFEPLPQDDPARRRLDIAMAGQLLGWAPKITLRQGLELSLDHFRTCVQSRQVCAYKFSGIRTTGMHSSPGAEFSV